MEWRLDFPRNLVGIPSVMEDSLDVSTQLTAAWGELDGICACGAGEEGLCDVDGT